MSEDDAKALWLAANWPTDFRLWDALPEDEKQAWRNAGDEA